MGLTQKVKTAIRASSKELSVRVAELLGSDGRIYTADELPKTLRNWCEDLWCRNMQPLYENSIEGYHPEEKAAELFDRLSRFVIFHDPITQQPIAYTMFRFDMEETNSSRQAQVVYCYEVQVEAESQSQGLGKRLVAILEKLGKELRLDKVMLTVFLFNEGAMKLYKNAGYEVDEISPVDEADREDYEIMSKRC